MTERAMLDVSMLAHRISLTRMRALARNDPEILSGLVVSDAFVQLIRAVKEQGELAVVAELIHTHFRVPRAVIDIGYMLEFTESSVFRDIVGLYRRRDFEDGKNPPAYRALLEVTGNEWVTQIIYEEWEYLMSHSWLFSKTRAVYDHVVNTGGNALYLTKRKFEHAIWITKQTAKKAGESTLKGSDFVVGKTVKKPQNERISPNDRVRALAKWVAIGGGAATAVMVPLVGIPVSVATNMFLLYDP